MKSTKPDPGIYRKTVIWTILLAGTLDISAAFLDSFIRNGLKPILVLQYIASGVLGRQAFSMGWTSGVLGLLFHFMFVTIWTLLFFFLYPRIRIKPRWKYMAGITFGILIWLVMNLIIVPLSATNKFQHPPLSIFLGIIYVVCMVGLPISLMYHHNLSSDSQ